MSQQVPTRDANIQAWQVKVALAFNDLVTTLAPAIGSGAIGILPVVTGEVPPNFITDDDGNLIYAEVTE